MLGKKLDKPLEKGITLLEWLVLVVCVVILAGMLVPATTRKGRAPLTACVNNLKHLGIGFRLYANDNDEHFPMQLSTNAGGSMEFTNKPAQAWRHFWAAGSELSNPRILLCPAAKYPGRTPVDFLSPGDDRYLTYFIGIHAKSGMSNIIFSGDADIHLRDRLLPKATAFPLSTNYAWGKRHRGRGNVAFADGAVQTMDSRKFVEAVHNQTAEEGRSSVE